MALPAATRPNQFYYKLKVAAGSFVSMKRIDLPASRYRAIWAHAASKMTAASDKERYLQTRKMKPLDQLLQTRSEMCQNCIGWLAKRPALTRIGPLADP